jgi:CHASE2 domain-containing sensor protein
VANPQFYTVSGAVQTQGGLYLERKADTELLELCRQGFFAYVLTSRQMGKSSLMIQTSKELKKEGVQTAIVDLQRLGESTKLEQWYLGFLEEVTRKLRLEINLRSWWQEHEYLGVTQRFTLFFEDIVLIQVSEQIVIFVDEIDTTLKLDFTDDFFIAVRSFHSSRSLEPKFNRLSFVLVGVAAPTDLIRDLRRTPFNIGCRVELTDFTYREVIQLSDGFGLPKVQSRRIIRRIFKWTNGHPYLTQRVCQGVTTSRRTRWTNQQIDSLVKEIFLRDQGKKDTNIQSVEKRLTNQTFNTYEVLSTYQYIYQGIRPTLDDEKSMVKSDLKLSGVVRSHNGNLRVSNLIYRKIFNSKWIQQHLPTTLKSISIQRILFTSAIVALLTIGLRQLGLFSYIELQDFDRLTQFRPAEATDPHLLVVGITEQDLASIRRYPVPDQEIASLIKTLNLYQPTVIGIDLIRDIPIEPGHDELVKTIKESNNIVGIETILPGEGELRISAPAGLAEDRIGFIDILIDDDDDESVRRSLLASPDSQGKFKFSFPLRLAEIYLSQQSFNMESGRYDPDTIRFGSIEIPRLTALNHGGYKPSFDDGGIQTLLSFRSGKEKFRVISLTDVKNQKFEPEWIHNRVVLIGMTASTAKDTVRTPYGQEPVVIFQAHAVSQIISAVLDKRPILQSLPIWWESSWILCWALIGGLIFWKIDFSQILRLAITVVFLIASIGVIYLTSFIIFLSGYWVAIFPALVALITTSVSLFSYSVFKVSEYMRRTRLRAYADVDVD